MIESGFLIKICGITTAGDALDAVEAGATALGFNFCPRSPRYITPDCAAGIIGGLPGGILKVGVFVDEPADSIAAIVRGAGLDVAQLHGQEPPGQQPAGVRSWKALCAGEGFDAAQLALWPVEAILLDSSSGGSGRTFNWRLAHGLAARIILAGGLDASNVADAIAQARPWGVDACSRLESAPGRKDRTRVRDFVRAALAARRLLDYV
ncbi:MAG: phosphoribosylanthranilate isomerase [Bryobacterales bacterium]|nr:phosphoribosylanthranilate isomerase [Bryobacterales bacterium]